MKILSKDARNDPFADLPPLSDKEMKRGLSDLITNGVIPKDLDLAPAFEKNPPLTNLLLKLIKLFFFSFFSVKFTFEKNQRKTT